MSLQSGDWGTSGGCCWWETGYLSCGEWGQDAFVRDDINSHIFSLIYSFAYCDYCDLTPTVIPMEVISKYLFSFAAALMAKVFHFNYNICSLIISLLLAEEHPPRATLTGCFVALDGDGDLPDRQTDRRIKNGLAYKAHQNGMGLCPLVMKYKWLELAAVHPQHQQLQMKTSSSAGDKVKDQFLQANKNITHVVVYCDYFNFPYPVSDEN